MEQIDVELYLEERWVVQLGKVEALVPRLRWTSSGGAIVTFTRLPSSIYVPSVTMIRGMQNVPALGKILYNYMHQTRVGPYID